MKKTAKKQPVRVEKLPRRMLALLFLPWRANHANHYTEVEAYVPGGDWQTILKINDTNNIEAETLSDFILLAANNFEKSQQLISQMATALENCIACDRNLTVKAEQEATFLIREARQHIVTTTLNDIS